MHVLLHRAADLGADETARWRAAHGADPALAHPALSPDFTRIVGEVRPEARVAVAVHAGRTAWFAHERRSGGHGTVIGTGAVDTGGIAHEPGFTGGLGPLLAACGLQTWHGTLLNPRADPSRWGEDGHLRRLGDTPNPVVDLSRGHAAYQEALRRRSSGAPRDLRKKARRMERDVGLRFVLDEPDPAVLRTLTAWKHRQYRAGGWPDPLEGHRGTELLERLARSRTPGCTGTVSVLYAGDGRPAAVMVSLRSATVMAGCVTGYDHGFAAYSPGSLLLWRLLEAACGLGVRHYDMGTGDQRYKHSLMTAEHLLPEVLALRRTPAGLARYGRALTARTLRDAVTSRPALRAGVRGTLARLGRARTR